MFIRHEQALRKRRLIDESAADGIEQVLASLAFTNPELFIDNLPQEPSLEPARGDAGRRHAKAHRRNNR